MIRTPTLSLICVVSGIGIGTIAALLGHGDQPAVPAVKKNASSPLIDVNTSPDIRAIVESEAGTFSVRFEEILNRTTDDDSERYYLLSLLLDRWIDIDPGEAAATLPASDRPAFGFFTAWGMRDPEAALEAALGYKHESWRTMSVAAALSSVSKEDPQRFLEIAVLLDKTLIPAGNVTIAFASIAERDPEKALADAATWGEAALKGVAEGWARRDPREALRWVEEGHEKQLAVVLEEWAKTDPHAAIDHLATQSAPSADRNLVRSLVSELAKADPAAALQWLHKHAPDNAGIHASKVLAQVEGEPDQLWRLVRENIMGFHRTRALTELGRIWRREDFEKFFESSRDFPPEEKEAAIGMMRAWGSRRFDEALAYARQIEDPEQGLKYLGAALSGGSNHGSHLQAWAMALEWAPTSREHFHASEQVTDEELAQSLLTGELSNPTSTAHRLNMIAPEQGARWLVTHPKADEIAHIAQSMTQKWADQNPEEASEWLGSLPASKARDFAAVGLIDAVAPFDPAGAFIWATEIGDPARRADALTNSFKALLWSDRDAAVGALNSSNLPEAEKARLLNLENTNHE